MLLAGLALLMGGCSESPTEPPPVDLEDGHIYTVIGTGRPGYNGDGLPPTQSFLYWPIDLIQDSEDRLIVLDWNNFRVRRVDHDGLLRTVVGTGFEDFVVDGSHALETALHHAYSLDLDTSGNLFIAGFHIPQVIRIDTEWISRIVAGRELPGYDGDGGPAVDAALDSPCGIAVHPSGFPIYMADTYNDCIRAIDASGIIATICGTGTPGYRGDGGPAVDAELNEPYRIRFHTETGALYISDTLNHVIRRINADGIIETVAGNGTKGFSGDGGPALEASLERPQDMRVGSDGRLYIADTYNHRIRVVDADGTIRTLAGIGTRGSEGDGGPALQAELNYPHAILFDAEGNLWIADTFNSRVRVVPGVIPSPAAP